MDLTNMEYPKTHLNVCNICFFLINGFIENLQKKIHDIFMGFKKHHYV